MTPKLRLPPFRHQRADLVKHPEHSESPSEVLYYLNNYLNQIHKRNEAAHSVSSPKGEKNEDR